MASPITRAISAIASGISRAVSAVTNSGIVKAAKFLTSVAVGLPIAAVASIGAGATYIIFKAASVFDTKVIKGVFGSTLVPDAEWDERLTSLRGFMGNVWKDFGVHAYLTTAEYLKGKLKETGDEYGWIPTDSESDNPENTIATQNEEGQKKAFQKEAEKHDKFPSTSPQPSSVHYVSPTSHGHDSP